MCVFEFDMFDFCVEIEEEVEEERRSFKVNQPSMRIPSKLQNFLLTPVSNIKKNNSFLDLLSS